MGETAENPWLVLIHQLPPKPPYLRVKVWRRLQAVGSVPIKNSVYVLPNTTEAREDFEWMLREIQQEGGEASLCEARLVDGLSDEDVRTSFQAARESDYRALADDARALARDVLPRRGKPLTPEGRSQIEVALARLRKRLAEIGRIDFFAAAGRAAVEGLLADLEKQVGGDEARRPAAQSIRRREDVQGRLWVTRSGVHIDRIASAWLIRRFIDGEARFKFVSGKGYRAKEDELRFDMFEGEFTHAGDLCTFEVLLRDFGITDPALRGIGEIVHDIDLKDEKFGRVETVGVDHMIIGISWANPDDEGRLSQGAQIFDALHAYLKRRKA